ncbi:MULTISPECIES: sigma 54-interacting transcriptional regulator [unclassified Lentimonas]|uniref:sigma 54-interacting transcriptional regulator n=1 Tax=unclassified Lentimonas TaxID=2630993 RepID=UPI001320E525|nr:MULTISPECIES: sigma 54-interacting transcriptional regulator [unclassified Lentimonas]CAA6677143.1 Response regulator of zinc sigma-54-dependent two-component system [Lentimonas sp. CC4]CAA6686233.1 Response regulator of zinc sigma-54-dependent two-component system [Lentimonas sp. CC6]CAA7074263.1 Response regulator of zinc sigma-54-dependent two-component system [Lentimonas sp. CC4]CAA7171094.1 Response regulator of zinc sigma-54-dependent two-component system [Lentimonas sp. CC21]CAA71809
MDFTPLIDDNMRGCQGISRSQLAHCGVETNLSMLLNISHMLESSIKLEDVLRPVMNHVSETLKLRRCTISILNPNDGKLQLEETISHTKEIKNDEYLHRHAAVFQETIQKDTCMIIPDISNEIDMQSEERALKENERIALICMPIKSGPETFGLLTVEKRAHRKSSLQSSTQILTLITRVIAQALNFRLRISERFNALEEENERLLKQISTKSKNPAGIIGNSSAMHSVYSNISQVAPTNATVLIRGESGVGKELVAKALHQQSERADKPFIKFNCAALSDSIIESELFGHEKGSFTGAHALRKGRFEEADGGTIFLDEIGDISPSVQVKLLRVIQEREFERVGGNSSIKVDVRIITATSRDLESMVEAQRFRSDLYYRLNVFPIYVPALRERRSDTLALADFFLERFSSQNGKHLNRISSAAIDLLHSYHWPGNVRELENVIERAAILAAGSSIEAMHLPPTLQKRSDQETITQNGSLQSAISAVEREMIVNTLKEHKGNLARAARQLDISERIIGLRVKKYQINPALFK